MSKTAVDRLLDEIDEIRMYKGLSVADLARELGLQSQNEPSQKSSGYMQLYKWLIERRDKPSGENILMLSAWRDKNQK